jgi:hypothetical protein
MYTSLIRALGVLLPLVCACASQSPGDPPAQDPPGAALTEADAAADSPPSPAPDPAPAPVPVSGTQQTTGSVPSPSGRPPHIHNAE